MRIWLSSFKPGLKEIYKNKQNIAMLFTDKNVLFLTTMFH